MARFVRPQTKTLTLANGDTLVVRERLTAGEQRAQYARMFRTRPDGSLERDPLMPLQVCMVLAYLLDWHLKDDQDQPAIRDLSTDDLYHVINGLTPEAFEEIRDAIQEHEAAMLEARTQKKTTPNGGTPS